MRDTLTYGTGIIRQTPEGETAIPFAEWTRRNVDGEDVDAGEPWREGR